MKIKWLISLNEIKWFIYYTSDNFTPFILSVIRQFHKLHNFLFENTFGNQVNTHTHFTFTKVTYAIMGVINDL